MQSLRVREAVVLVAALALSSGCEEPTLERPPDEGTPRGFVEFYIPLDEPWRPDPGVDAIVYRLEDGERRFEGMTRKWAGLSNRKRGLAIALTPGEYTFSIELGEGSKQVRLRVEEGVFHPVRVTLVEVSSGGGGGALRLRRYRIEVTTEKPLRPDTPVAASDDTVLPK